MDAHVQEALEETIRGHCQAGALERAATEAMRGYGPPIFGLLLALHRNEEQAGEVFSMFSEDLWRGLAAFGWQCSFRTWAYTLARNASHRYRKSTRRAAGAVPLSDCPALSAMEAQVRSQTLPHLRTQNKSRIAALRERLSPEDQTLLILRVDKGMAWGDLARVMLGEAAPEEAALKKEAARLRKRFQLVKERLLELGRREGLLDGEGAGGAR
jgi:RNA polymerase sigma-70 factor (ECF subfamily)